MLEEMVLGLQIGFSDKPEWKWKDLTVGMNPAAPAAPKNPLAEGDAVSNSTLTYSILSE